MRAIVITAKDNVATALEDIPAGAKVKLRLVSEEREVQLQAAIPFRHKFALQPIAAGGNIIKYGEVMGKATAAIKRGFTLGKVTKRPMGGSFLFIGLSIFMATQAGGRRVAGISSVWRCRELSCSRSSDRLTFSLGSSLSFASTSRRRGIGKGLSN